MAELFNAATIGGETFFAEDAVGLTHRAMRPIVGKQWKWNTAELFGPGLEARNRVGTDLENLDVQLLEFFVVRTEPTDLVLSPAGESHRQKADDRRPAAVSSEGNLLICVVRPEREIRRRGAYLQCHASSPCVRRQGRCSRIPRLHRFQQEDANTYVTAAAPARRGGFAATRRARAGPPAW